MGSLSRPAIGFVNVPILAAFITWLTGFVISYHSSSQGEISQYGLPLIWKTHVEYPGYAGRFGIVNPVSFTTYSLDMFLLDALLYGGIALSIILWYQGHLSLFKNAVIPLSAAWLTYAIANFPGSSRNGPWTNGFPIGWMGLFIHGWTYNWIGLGSDVALIAALEYFALFLYRGVTMINGLGRCVPPRPLSGNA